MILLFLNIETKQTACEFSNYKAFWIISIHVTFKISNFMALCLCVLCSNVLNVYFIVSTSKSKDINMNIMNI